MAARELERPLLAIVPRESEALAWLQALDLLVEDAEAVYFPAPSLTPYQETEASLLVRAQETLALDRIAHARLPVVVCTPRALFRWLPDPAALVAGIVELEPGAEVALEVLARQLSSRGYQRSEMVVEVGSFAVRGGVFDLFPPGEATPIRLDLFGDRIESIRRFDPVTQRSFDDPPRSVRVRPLTLFPAGAAEAEQLAELLTREVAGAAGSGARERIATLRRGETFAGWEHYLALLADRPRGLDQILEGAMVATLDPEVLVEEANRHQRALEVEHRTRAEQGRLALPPERLERPLADVLAVLERAEVAIEAAGSATSSATSSQTAIDFAAAITENFSGQLPRFGREVEIARDRHERLVVVSPERHHERLRDLLEGRDINFGPDGVALAAGELDRGFRLPSAGLVLFGESQLFTSRPQAAPSRRPFGPFLTGLRDLRVGEYVVHEEHGVGQYLGMRALEPETTGVELPPSLVGITAAKGSALEMMEIVYADGKTLLLPLSRLDLIQKFGGIEGVAPKLDRLGGTSWNKKKARARRTLRKLATDLLKLYAERELATAAAAGPDSDDQSRFEAAFEFEETEDQLQAIAEVKADLARTRPMDRLLCGDVGFGKTEVGMRAAFKMIDHGHQVAVLAPTTILADQHLQTFRQRFAEFPVIIDMVSRFRTPAEVRAVLDRVAAGAVDLLIGTHRLLSRDVRFKRLGLLIVDEEQRFGVGQKERIKELRKNVHVLAMSATPVPRTLQLSLAGVREMSTIESPPRDRMSVETQILPFAEDLVREAIEFELERGGQIYYVHNRVEDIEQISGFLRELVPGLRITVGHGQMDERELGRRMRAFKAGEYDLLLATTIIENGIDIPRVNTMLVHRADRFGLAQLYQLRGRVGRSSQLAFCYLLVPPDRILTEETRRRLAAIEEFSELGAGFRIAARDLEIRGAGALLGAEQSGHISELGIETYVKMLREAVTELRGEVPAEAPTAQIDLPVAMAVPRDYVEDTNQRMEVYRRLASGQESSRDVLAELRDRFGPPPQSVHTLAEVCELKRFAERLRVQSISHRGFKLTFALRRDARVDVERLIRWVSEQEHATFSPGGVLRIDRVPGAQSLAVAREVLEAVAPEQEAAREALEQMEKASCSRVVH